MFAFTKWYFDFLTPADEFVFVFVALVRFMGRTFGNVTLHVARPDRPKPQTVSISIGQHTLTNGESLSIHLPQGEITVSGEECTVDVSTSQWSTALRFLSGSGTPRNPLLIRNGRRSMISWRPIGMGYDVSGSVSIGPDVLQVRDAAGYVDHLESTFLPPLVPVRRLYWGRLHNCDFDFAYVKADGGPGKAASWAKAYLREGNTMHEAEDVRMDFRGTVAGSLPAAGDGSDYTLNCGFGATRLVAEVQHIRPVQQVSFIETADIRLPALRAILAKITRNPRGVKFLARADVAVTGRGTHKVSGPMIDEVVYL